tara:strand:+ start:650 stop:1621 length:972 start_codon:yes stop_codon:yes gene_type:complete
MKKNNYKKIAKEVIDLEIQALKKLKKSINNSFDQAVNAITKCQSKIILCGVGKSYLIASKISATLSSVGCPSFSLAASDSAHGDLGRIQKKDVLILISKSGDTKEIRPVIQFANRYKITLIGIVSKKNSLLYRASDIKLFIPETKEAGLGGIVPTSSTTAAICLGDSLAVAALNKKGFKRKNFKTLHPAGSLGTQLKTAEDLMITKKEIPFINENSNMKNALNIITKKKLGVLIAVNKKKITTGIITDGQIRRLSQKSNNLKKLLVKNVMTKDPISIKNDTLASKSLSIMSEKKITSLCVHNNNKKKTIGLLHVHMIIGASIS